METDHLLLRGDLLRTPTFEETEANLKYLEGKANAAAPSAAAAAASQVAAEVARDAANTSKIDAAQSESDAGASATQAVAARQAAETARDTATQKAASATADAATATAQASTATTQAGIATTQAGTATTQAGIATTKAGEASASAAAASAATAAIANGTATDAGALTGAETTPLSRSAGLLQTTLAKIRDYILAFLTGAVVLEAHYQTADGNDYAPAFRRAITALNALGGGRILLGNKTYRVVATAANLSINVGANITIEGSQNTVINLDTDVPGSGYRQLFSQVGNNVTLRNFSIVRVAEMACVLITQGGYTGLTFDNVSVDGRFNTYGANYCHFLQVGTSNGVTGGGIFWKGGTAKNCSYGLFMTNASTATVVGITVRDVTFTNNYATDLEFNSPNGSITDVAVLDCSFSNNQATTAAAGFAIGFAHVARGKVSRGYINNYFNEGIHVEDYSTDIVIDGVSLTTIGKNQGAYIRVISGCDGVMIHKCFLDGTANTVNIRMIDCQAGGSGTTPGGRTVIAPRRLNVAGNKLRAGANCSGIYFESILQGVIGQNELSGAGNVSGGVYSGSTWWGINVYDGAQIEVAGNVINGFLWAFLPRQDSINAFGNGSVVSGNSIQSCALGLALLNPKALTATGNVFDNCVKPAIIGAGSSSGAGISKAVVYVGNLANGCTYPQAITGTNTISYSGGSTISTGSGVTVAIQALDTFLPSGTVLTFTGGGVLTLTADKVTQQTSLVGNLTVASIAPGATATYSVTFASGTVIASNVG